MDSDSLSVVFFSTTVTVPPDDTGLVAIRRHHIPKQLCRCFATFDSHWVVISLYAIECSKSRLHGANISTRAWTENPISIPSGHGGR